MTTTLTVDGISGEELAGYVERAAAYRLDGGKLGRDRQGGYWASSTSQPGTWHVVTLASCSCRGFIHHGHCKHHSALMVAVILKGEPEPGAPASASCRSCDGRGFHIKARNLGRGQFVREDVPCPACHGDRIAA